MDVTTLLDTLQTQGYTHVHTAAGAVPLDEWRGSPTLQGYSFTLRADGHFTMDVPATERYIPRWAVTRGIGHYHIGKQNGAARWWDYVSYTDRAEAEAAAARVQAECWQGTTAIVVTCDETH